LENLSLSEQAKVFAEASVIIGPSGAAWTGMIFSERPVIGLSWLPTEYEEFSSYSTLANLLGHRLTLTEAKTRHELTSTGKAYTADYFVSPREFEDAIQRVLGELAP
jgi:capsular polysaccharide biosynthesis protein